MSEAVRRFGVAGVTTAIAPVPVLVDRPLADQAHFLATAACDERAAPVLDLMGRLVADQGWGRGAVEGATPSGTTSVAIAAQYGSGTHDDDAATLTTTAHWVAGHAAVLPAGRCVGL